MGQAPTEYETHLSIKEDRIKSKHESEIAIDNTTPSEKVHEMLGELEILKKNEISRIIKDNLSITLSERQNMTLQKTFLFLLGKYEGTEALRQFLREKKVN